MIILKPQSKRSLLESSLRVKPPGKNRSICFPKILFTEKYLFQLAKSRSMFRFRMSSNGSETKFCFTSHTDDLTKDFELDLERAKRLLLMISPEYFDVSIDNAYANSDFFKLIAHANNKLSMICDYEDESVPEVVLFFWMRYNELYIPEFILSCIPSWILESKTFEKMEVKLISSDGELAFALKQQAEYLILGIGGPEDDNFSNLDSSRVVVNRSAKKCALKFSRWMSPDDVLSIVKVVVGSVQYLETLEIHFGEKIYDEERRLGVCFVNSFKVLCQLVEFLQDKPFDVKFEMHAGVDEYSNFELPAFWLSRIQNQNPELKDVWHRTELIESTDDSDKYQTKMWLSKKAGRINATFSANLTYNDWDWELHHELIFEDDDDYMTD